MGLKILTLGAASLLFNEQSLDAQLGTKARAILLYVALQGTAVSREKLAAMFWKDSPQERASGNLRMSLMSLRERLGESAHITRSEVEIVGWSDVAEFQTTIDNLTSFTSGIEDQSEALEEGLQLYKGPFLHNFSVPDAEQFELWTHATRETLQRQFFKATETLICLYEESGHYDKALHWSSYVLKIDPLHEPAYRSLMRIYSQRGERVLAIREFETCKRLLTTELNVEPDQETVRLYERIIASTVPEVAPTKAVPPVILMAKRSIPHNLPGQLTPLIGRTEELSHLKSLFKEARLITIVGTGGIGKTRLAVEFGTQMLAHDRYTDGIYFVDLSSVQYPSQVIEATASALDIAESPHMSISAQIMRHVKNKRLLLILDNFEHVLDAADQLEEWLKASAQLSILVTSREPLQLYAEYLYTVPSLPMTDAWSLFAKRVNAVKSGFTMTEENAPVVQAICTRLEGLPLAIELAASHAQSLSLDRILQGLDDSMAFLKSQHRGGLERQRTMYGAIEWSYQLLTYAEQALYRLVSVFVGGWTLESVEAIGGELAFYLPALVAKNLVQAVAAHPQRFRMLESIREHARHKLTDHNETFLFEEAHLHYFTALAETAGRGLHTHDEQVWFDRLESDYDNLRAALLFADQHEAFAEPLCRLVAGLGFFYYVRGYAREGREWVEKALQKQADLAVEIQAGVLTSAGHIAHLSADYALADEHHKAALLLYLGLEDWVNSAFLTSIVSMREANQERSLALTQEAYHLAQRTEDDFVLFNAANSYAVALEQMGRLEEAREILEEIIETGTYPKTFHPIILFNLGCIYRDTGQTGLALQIFEECMALLRQGYAKFAIPNVFEEIGDFYYALENIERATACYDEAYAGAEAIAAEIHIHRLHRAKAMIAWTHQNLDDVKAYYQIAFQGPMDDLTIEDWNSFIVGVLHIAEILALKQQAETSALVLGAVVHHTSTRQTRLTYPHLYLKERCLQALRCQTLEEDTREAMRAGEVLSEAEMFAQALAALEALD